MGTKNQQLTAYSRTKFAIETECFRSLLGGCPTFAAARGRFRKLSKVNDLCHR